MKYINILVRFRKTMIKKYYWAIAVAAAFVAGTIATATPVYAPPNEDDDNGLVDAVNRIADILDMLEQIAGPQGEQGDQGEQGEQGDPGSASGVLGYYRGQVEEGSGCTLLMGDASTFCSVSCDTGDVLVNVGGTEDTGTSTRTFTSLGEIPSNTGGVIQTNNNDINVGIQIEVLCADFDPLHNNAD